jgi:putative NIF3 family GTP cyclohydrolase 1 type 2
VSLDLESLYRKLVQAHIPLPARAGETTSALISRFQEIETKRREYKLTEAKLKKELQFNKKVQLNDILRSISQDLDKLTNI